MRLSANHFFQVWIFPIETLLEENTIQSSGKFLDTLIRIESANLIRRMAGLFNQKRKLGLIEYDQDLQKFSDERPLLILTLLNIDLQSWEFREVLAKLPDYANVEVRTATCGSDGFGLFDRNVFKLH